MAGHEGSFFDGVAQAQLRGQNPSPHSQQRSAATHVAPGRSQATPAVASASHAIGGGRDVSGRSGAAASNRATDAPSRPASASGRGSFGALSSMSPHADAATTIAATSPVFLRPVLAIVASWPASRVPVVTFDGLGATLHGVRRREQRCGALRLLGIFAFVMGAHLAAACNDSPLKYFEPCRGIGCSCESDPNQPLCRGFNERPEASPGFDAGIVEASDDVLDAGEIDAGSDATDADDDAG